MTDISPETKSKWWIPKHRYYELKHFCLQYSNWQKQISLLQQTMPVSGYSIDPYKPISQCSPVERIALKILSLQERINIVEDCIKDAGGSLAPYLFNAVTNGVSFAKLSTQLDIPCSKDMFYDRYRKFFWLLDTVRG